MEKNIVMPRLRPEMEKGVLCAWLKEEGEPVSAGEPLFESRRTRWSTRSRPPRTAC